MKLRWIDIPYSALFCILAAGATVSIAGNLPTVTSRAVVVTFWYVCNFVGAWAGVRIGRAVEAILRAPHVVIAITTKGEE